MSIVTVKAHIARVFQKLDLHNLAQTAVLAYETRLGIPGESAQAGARPHPAPSPAAAARRWVLPAAAA